MSGRDELDALLSAWIDGELDAGESAAVAERVRRDPELARRVEALRGVDAALRAIPAPEPSRELRRRFEVRLAAEGSPARVVALPRRRLRWAAAAAALAAGLALYWGVRTPAPGPPVPEVVEVPESAPRAEGPGPEPAPAETASPQLARVPEASAAESAPVAPSADPDPDLAELALALDYELLRDFDVIDQLELLEVLAAYEERQGPGAS